MIALRDPLEVAKVGYRQFRPAGVSLVTVPRMGDTNATTPPARSPYLELTESQWQEVVVARAHARGWLIHHDRRQDLGIGGDPGFPDLVLARRGVVLFVELKSESGRLSGPQRVWLSALGSLWLHGARSWAVVWRPRDWHIVERVLDSAGDGYPDDRDNLILLLAELAEYSE